MGIDLLGMLIVYILFGGLGILISAFIMRAIFKIPTITNNLIEQTSLLRDIAASQREILKNQEEAKKKTD